jgi:F-type H+-transporting ATPase subunit gamma
MELISRAQFKRAMDRAVAATAYTRRITALVRHLRKTAPQLRHPLLEPRPETRRALLLVLTANRGLCGGYNAGVLRLAYGRREALRQEASQTRLEVSGKRGISAFRFRGIPPDQRFTHFQDKPVYEEVELLANRYLEDYGRGELDRLEIVYTKFENLSRQRPVVETLLPLAPPAGQEEEEELRPEPRFEFLPSVEGILDEVLPASFRARLWKCFLDAAVSEQIARMLAMKNATDNADAMIDQLTITYNRARQGQITSELLEVIGGANALEQ